MPSPTKRVTWAEGDTLGKFISLIFQSVFNRVINIVILLVKEKVFESTEEELEMLAYLSSQLNSNSASIINEVENVFKMPSTLGPRRSRGETEQRGAGGGGK